MDSFATGDAKIKRGVCKVLPGSLVADTGQKQARDYRVPSGLVHPSSRRASRRAPQDRTGAGWLFGIRDSTAGISLLRRSEEDKTPFGSVPS
jgi:hypothetical protein